MRPTSEFLKENETRVVHFSLKKAFDNAFVSKKNKKGGFQYPNDIADLQISAEIVGLNNIEKHTINPYASSEDLDEHIATYKKLQQANFRDFPFVGVSEAEKIINFKPGKFSVSETINIPEGYTVMIAPNFTLDFKNGASLLSKSTIIAQGEKKYPVNFISTDGTGGGLFITNAPEESKLSYCNFINLSNPKNKLWEVSGAVNFHESDVVISNSQFKNNRCEDALNVISSDFTLKNSQFYDTFSDSFDGDFVTGIIKDCQFYNSGNDGVDVSGSQLVLENILIENPSDKGVSAGENSKVSGTNITVENGEIGIVSKDLSTINFTNVTLKNTHLGFSAFQKKSEYGTASISINGLKQINNEEDYLIENRSSLKIDGRLMVTVSNRVIDQMYGNEYGKSSK